MDIALIGTGRMGAAVEEAAVARGWRVRRRFDSAEPLTTVNDDDALGDVDAVIDFSSPDAFEQHLRRCVAWQKPLVCGTTGLGDRLDAARAFVSVGSGSVLYSPNFSIGVAMLRRALRATAELAARLDRFSVQIHEVHHTAKRDRPSGTALQLANDLSAILSPDQPPPDVSSARVGSVFGEHTVRFESPDDQIVLHHTARNRHGFADGALDAAEWLRGRSGFFSLDDMLTDWIIAEPSKPSGRSEHATTI